jgi:hypothetical protein
MSLVKDFFSFFNIFEDVYKRIKELLIPKQAYSWQTLIYLSLFSWLMSSLAIGVTRDLIAFFGWVFLIAGTSWYTTTDKPIMIPGTNLPIGAVITGFLVSAYAGRSEDVFTPVTIVLWPTIAAIITAIPEFFEGSGIDSKRQLPKLEIRQRIIILLAACMVLSCWLQLCFTVNKWTKQYPSIMTDDFALSTLVLKPEPLPRETKKSPEKVKPTPEKIDASPPKIELMVRPPKVGLIIINRLQSAVEDELQGKLWSVQSNNQIDTGKWLLEANTRVGTIGQNIINKYAAEYERKNLVKYEERVFWTTEARVENTKSTDAGYRLDLFSVWKGPRSDSKKYFLKKSCNIDPISKPVDNNTVNIKNPGERVTEAEVQCEDKTEFFKGSLPVKQ